MFFLSCLHIRHGMLLKYEVTCFHHKGNYWYLVHLAEKNI